MKARFQRNYRSQNTGTPTFVYSVSGTEAEIAQYKTAQGDFLRTDDESGAPLWFTTRYAGDVVNLIITQAGNVIADMSEFDKANSLVEQYGGNLGEKLAEGLVGKLLGGSAPASSSAPAESEPAEQDESKLDDM